MNSIHYPPASTEISSAEIAAMHRAEDAQLLADTHNFIDWLAGECLGCGDVDSGWIVTWPAKVNERLAKAKTAEIVHLLINCTEYAPAALAVLKRRYLSAQYAESAADVLAAHERGCGCGAELAA